MSKLDLDLGTYTIENDNVIIEYEIIDESFDHAFGTQYQTSFEIKKVEVYIPLVDKYVDMTHVGDFDAACERLILDDIQSMR